MTHLVIDIGAQQASDATSPGVQLELSPSSTTNGGTLHFGGLAPTRPGSGSPNPATGWSGELSWHCPF